MNNLKQIQKWMKTNNVDLFIVNRTDEFLSEYIASYAERLQWVSNFSGSAGRSIILQDKAIIFVDGRYAVQVHEQVETKYFNIEHLEYFWNIFENNIQSNFFVGIDPTLHSCFEIEIIERLTKKKNSFIKYFNKNPIDILWENQPSYPVSEAFILK